MDNIYWHPVKHVAVVTVTVVTVVAAAADSMKVSQFAAAVEGCFCPRRQRVGASIFANKEEKKRRRRNQVARH